MAKKTYSPEEKKAYHMGRAYATAKAGKRVKCTGEKEKQSFRNGVNAVRGKSGKPKGKAAGKVPKGNYYLVDDDGVIVGVASGKK